MPLPKDLLYPSLKENRKHKKSLLQSPRSYFMDVKCPGCYNITTIFSYAQTAVLCVGCSAVLCQPTGGKARLTKDTPSERSSTKSTLYQEEWRAIPINMFWIQRERERNLKSHHWKQELFKRASGFFILPTKLEILGNKFSASSNMVV